jgi:hypothetical protein
MHVYVSGKAALRTRIADLESAHHPPTAQPYQIRRHALLFGMRRS